MSIEKVTRATHIRCLNNILYGPYFPFEMDRLHKIAFGSPFSEDDLVSIIMDVPSNGVDIFEDLAFKTDDGYCWRVAVHFFHGETGREAVVALPGANDTRCGGGLPSDRSSAVYTNFRTTEYDPNVVEILEELSLALTAFQPLMRKFAH